MTKNKRIKISIRRDDSIHIIFGGKKKINMGSPLQM